MQDIYNIGDVYEVLGLKDRYFVLLSYDLDEFTCRLIEVYFSNVLDAPPETIEVSLSEIRVSTKKFENYIVDRFSSLKEYMDKLNVFINLFKSNFFDEKYSGLSRILEGESYANFIDDNSSSMCKDDDKTFDEAIVRKEYPSLDRFYNIYNTIIKPLIKEIKEDYSCYVEPKLEITDKEQGVFEFDRASILLENLVGYYSVKHKKFVDFKDVELTTDLKYVLKEDKSKIELKPLIDENGNKKVISKNRFSYVVKEEVLWKTKKIRVVVEISGNAGRNCAYFKIRGYTAVGLVLLLEELGFDVSVVATMLINRAGNSVFDNVKQKEYVDGQFIIGSLVELKHFGEPLNTSDLLRVVAMPSFFRGIGFVDIARGMCEYNVKTPDIYGLGMEAEMYKKKNIIFNEYVMNEIEKNVITMPITDPTNEKNVYANIRNLFLNTIKYMLLQNSYKEVNEELLENSEFKNKC